MPVLQKPFMDCHPERSASTTCPNVAVGRGVEVEAPQRASEPAAEILSEAKEPGHFTWTQTRAPSLRSGFRLRTPASLTPASRLNFDSPSLTFGLAQDDRSEML